MGQCHEIFDRGFSSNNPPFYPDSRAEAVSHMASYLADIFEITFCKVRIPRSQRDRGIGFCGFNETVGLIPAVAMRPWDPTWKSVWKILKSQWDRGFSVFNETTRSDLKFSMIPREQISRSHWNLMTPRESSQKRLLALISFKGKP
jgi:hypothetical protein